MLQLLKLVSVWFNTLVAWVQAGFGMTAPDPRWHPRGMTMFDVGRLQQLDHEDIQPKVAHVIGNMLQAIAGGCQTGFCKVGACEEPR